MPNQLTVYGEQYIVESSFRTDLITRPGNIDVTLYNDSTDALGDTDNLSSLTTEPSGSNYARQAVSLDTSSGTKITITENSSNNFEAVADEVSFDASDSSQSVDGYLWIANFDATDATGGNNGDNIILTGSLSQTYDLSSVDTINVSNTGLEQT